VSVPESPFPLPAGLLFGLGLGGFFDGIVLHQLLQWHHMLSSWYPINSLDNLRLNTRWDGAFHSLTYLFVVGGLVVLWRRGHLQHRRWHTRSLAGTLLLGWGVFNVAEGLVDHQILGIHHVNETVSKASQWPWDAAFLAWGAVMILGGLWLSNGVGHNAPGRVR
jgi:uncharacterized membrane protein